MLQRVVLGFAFAIAGSPAFGCEVAKILFGDVRFDIVVHDTYETAIVRHANFQNKNLHYGAIKGEIHVERGGFVVRTIDQDLVGTISPSLVIDGGGKCDPNKRTMIKKVQPNVYVIMNGSIPVGSIQGRFPKNSFGVK